MVSTWHTVSAPPTEAVVSATRRRNRHLKYNILYFFDFCHFSENYHGPTVYINLQFMMVLGFFRLYTNVKAVHIQ